MIIFKNVQFCKRKIFHNHRDIIETFCEKIKKEEILLYIMQDKYSVKPDKEFRINHTTLEKKVNETEDKFKPFKIMHYGR